MKHLFPLFLTTLLVAFSANASAISRKQLAEYAASLKGKKGASLKSALQPLLKPKQTLGYGSGQGKTWSGFYKTDRIPETNECVNRYSSEKFYFQSTTSAISGMNIEHSFPKSWWGGAKNDAYKDLYHLYPSPSKGNSQKGNYPMAIVTNAKVSEEGYDKVGTGTVNGKSGVQCWEPGDRYKGDFARTYMYMAVAYGNLTFRETGLQTMTNEDYPGMKKWATDLYRQWIKADKVDDIEATRNNTVAGIEGNRNLFIDYPYLAEYVWGDSADVAFNPETAITTASDDDRYTGTITPVDPANPDEPSTDNIIFVRYTAQQPVAGQRYLIVASTGGSLLAAKIHNRNYDYLSTTTLQATDDKIAVANDKLDNVFTFEQANGGFLIKGSDNRYYYNDKSHKNFNASTSRPSNNVWTATKRADGTYSISNGTCTIQYSTQYKSFGAYSSTQSDAVYPVLYVEGNTSTGINGIHTDGQTIEKAAEGTYTLQGVKVDESHALQPGIYIRNGKKFVVK